MGQQFLNCTLVCTAKHNEAETVASCLTDDGGVCVVEQSVFKLLIDLLVV